MVEVDFIGVFISPSMHHRKVVRRPEEGEKYREQQKSVKNTNRQDTRQHGEENTLDQKKEKEREVSANQIQASTKGRQRHDKREGKTRQDEDEDEDRYQD